MPTRIPLTIIMHSLGAVKAYQAKLQFYDRSSISNLLDLSTRSHAKYGLTPSFTSRFSASPSKPNVPGVARRSFLVSSATDGRGSPSSLAFARSRNPLPAPDIVPKPKPAVGEIAPTRTAALARRIRVEGRVASIGENITGGAPASVSSREGEVGPGVMSGVPRFRGEVIKLGGVGDGKIGGRMIAE